MPLRNTTHDGNNDSVLDLLAHLRAEELNIQMGPVHAVPLCFTKPRHMLACVPKLRSSDTLSLEPPRRRVDNVYDSCVYFLIYKQLDVLVVWI